MSDMQARLSNSWNERLRINRLRRRKEKLQFWKEFGIVPSWLKGLVVVLWLIAVGIGTMFNLEAMHNPNGNDMFPPEWRNNALLSSLALAGIVTFVSLVTAILIFMVAYVNRDAARRGMNSGLWTLLVLVLMPGYLVIGFMVYFLMREPLPYSCPQCATVVGGRFNFCPNCKLNLQPTCPNCKREVAETDKFCPYCAADLKNVAQETEGLTAPK
jgi:RNA polymerase subunit RPABC4/transcription elongation factor Spt4